MFKDTISIRSKVRQAYMDMFHDSFIDSEDGQRVLDIMCDRFRLHAISSNLRCSECVSPVATVFTELTLEFGDRLIDNDYLNGEIVRTGRAVACVLGYVPVHFKKSHRMAKTA